MSGTALNRRERRVVDRLDRLEGHAGVLEAQQRAISAKIGDKETTRVPDRDYPPIGPNPDARMAVRSAQRPIDWAATYGDHDPDFIAGRIDLAEAHRRLEARRAAERPQAAQQGRRCMVCRGTGHREATPHWARENLELCPSCRGGGTNCAACRGTGRTEGERVPVALVPCGACKGSGGELGGGDDMWELADGRMLRGNDGTMGARTHASVPLWDTPGMVPSSDLPEFQRARLNLPMPAYPTSGSEWR